MNPSEVNESYTITAGVYTLTEGEYVDTGKILTFDSHAECQVWARDAQADVHSDKVHDHWNAAGDVHFDYDDVNSVFTWTEYGPELDAETVEGLCVNKEDGVTKTIDETNYYQDKTNLYLKIINIVTNDDTDFDAIRGFWVKDGESCYCLFDDEATVDGQTMNNPASGGGGTGLISSSDYTEGHCYKFDGQVEAVTASEAPSLSSSPSSQPSTNPSSSSEPSSIPSESPSISANPTSQPSSIPSEHPSISANPSNQLSENPSVSSSPSLIPSESPSISGHPSSIPSKSPSISSNPTSKVNNSMILLLQLQL